MYEAVNSLFSKEALSGSYPVPHMAPPTPSAGISVSVCGKSGQCFRSYPRNYTSVWLSAPGPQDVGTRYQTLIACRALIPPTLGTHHPHLFLSGPFYILSVLPSSIPQDNGRRRSFFKREKGNKRPTFSRCVVKFEKSRLKFQSRYTFSSNNDSHKLH